MAINHSFRALYLTLRELACAWGLCGGDGGSGGAAAAYIKALFLTCPACFSLALRECVEKKGIFVVILQWPGLAWPTPARLPVFVIKLCLPLEWGKEMGGGGGESVGAGAQPWANRLEPYAGGIRKLDRHNREDHEVRGLSICS